MSDVADGADVDRRLSRDYLRVERRDLGYVEVFQGLRGKMLLREHILMLISDDFCFRQFSEDEGLFSTRRSRGLSLR